MKPEADTFKQIEGLARIQCTKGEAAAVLGVCENTLEAFMRRHEKARDAWYGGIKTGKASLRRHQFKAAESGNATMQIWLGKQWLNQKDNLQLGGDPENPLEVIHNILGSIDGASRGLPGAGASEEGDDDVRRSTLAS